MFRFSIPGLALIAACDRPPKVDAVPAADVVPADANSDGYADVSDAVFLRQKVLHGGPAPRCLEAADINGDAQEDIGDILLLLSHALPGQTDLKQMEDDACDYGTAPTPPEAARLAVEIDAPKKATGDFEATVQIRSPERPVQGWTLSLVAEGCTITSATTDGTDADLVPAGGQRPMSSFATSVVTESGVAAGVLLDWQGTETLPAQEDAWTVLALKVAASAPASGCAECVIRTMDGQSAGGPPLRNAVTMDVWSYRPEPTETTVKICAG